ncbi:hypothetical protein D1007_15626 [Hordeum vulgare]|nr:hypothetical protein D1007_15626 [Hordeum vulgare]
MTSSTHGRLGHVNVQVALLMASELLRYLLADSGYNVSLGRITDLITTTGAHYHSLCPPPSCTRDVAHGESPPPPLCNNPIDPQHNARSRDKPDGAPAEAQDEASCQVVCHSTRA